MGVCDPAADGVLTRGELNSHVNPAAWLAVWVVVFAEERVARSVGVAVAGQRDI